MSRPSATHPLVMVFVKAPRAGWVKTRLAAQLGNDRAVDVYRGMVERQLREIPPGWPVEIHFTPAAAEDEVRAWLGAARVYKPQSDGDLGRRLRKAFGAAFARGVPSVLAIGGDCPELDNATFHETLGRLARADLVLGPATDGGYYLIALRRPEPELFDHIPWSSPQVLATTLARAKMLGLTRELLAPKDDVDDLPSYRRHLARVVRHASGDQLAIIVPTLNDADNIGETLDAAAQTLPAARLIVADGHSSDQTRAIATRHGALVVTARRGRSQQCRAGAAAADAADWLLFLHPDTRLPADAGSVFAVFTAQPHAQCATFRLRYDCPNWFLRVCGWCTRIDSVFTRFGDQGILIRREFYDALGGFPDWPLFEDVALLQRARAAARIHSLPATVTTSARRFEQHGALKQQWLNARLLARYLCGTPARELAAADRPAPAAPPRKSSPAIERTPQSVR